MWSLSAIRYAYSDSVPAARLLVGASHNDCLPMSWHFYLARGNGRVVLVDTGTDEFHLRPFGHRACYWGVSYAESVLVALREAGVRPDEVTDVALTHWHWDHCDGLVHFQRAVVHAHAGEWQQLRDKAAHPMRACLREIEQSGRAKLFEQGLHVVAPGLWLEEAGKHTAHHVVTHVECVGGRIIVLGDAAYLFRNVEEMAPMTCSCDRAANLRDLIRLRDDVGVSRLLPGHDPEVFSRFPCPTPNVATICA